MINNICILFSSADWYKGQLTDEELAALENPPTRKPRPATPIRRKGVKKPREEED